MTAHLVYLHGFASGPNGNKARHCRAWAEARGIPFHAPDLNLPDFEHLTITAQVLAVEAIVKSLPPSPILVGSSLGGLVAAAVAWRGADLKGLVLLAPAMGFSRRRLFGRKWSGYRKRGTIPVFHHAREAWERLGPDLLQDLPAWEDDHSWRIDLPIVILHGMADESVPIEESRAFAKRQPRCALHEMEDDHSLLKPEALATLDQVMEDFFR